MMDFSTIFPATVRKLFPENYMEGLEEIRVRAGRPLEFLYGDGKVMQFGVIGAGQIHEMLNYLSGYSMYALAEELKQGYLTMEGGHRIGVVGHVARTGDENAVQGDIQGLFQISGLNIRVAHEKKGCAAELVNGIRNGETIYNTLIFAPPGVGKTTYLRDCIRLLSSGDDDYPGVKVSVVDERSEIAACYQGVPQNDLGPRTDVLDNCPKERGMLMMIRSMSPQIIAVDELGEERDFLAVNEAIHSGSRILGTIHAENVEELTTKPYMHKILEHQLIGRFVSIRRRTDGTRIIEIYNEKLQKIC